MLLSAFGSKYPSLTCYTCTRSFPLYPSCTLEKTSFCQQWAVFWASVGGCVVATGKATLRCCQCVMQQSLAWKNERMFQVDVWKCYTGFVLSVGWLKVTVTFVLLDFIGLLHKKFFEHLKESFEFDFFFLKPTADMLHILYFFVCIWLMVSCLQVGSSSPGFIWELLICSCSFFFFWNISCKNLSLPGISMAALILVYTDTYT